MLKAYLAKHGHVVLIQVLQTWFHIDINIDNKKTAVSNTLTNLVVVALKSVFWRWSLPDT